MYEIATYLSGFNWATSFQTWKSGKNIEEICRETMVFQLGHVFSDMEIVTDPKEFAVAVEAFQLGHVFSDMEMLKKRG